MVGRPIYSSKILTRKKRANFSDQANLAIPDTRNSSNSEKKRAPLFALLEWVNTHAVRGLYYSRQWGILLLLRSNRIERPRRRLQ